MLPMTELTLSPGNAPGGSERKKFKTSLLAVTFVEPLTAEHAALHRCCPKVLHRGTQTHPDMQALSAALDELYGGSIQPILRKKGEVQCIGFWGSFLDEAFLPAGTSILEEASALLGELVLAPAGERGTFVPAYVGSEKKNLIDQIRAQLNDKLQYAMARLRSQMCQGEAYGLDKLGTEAQANAITGEALYTRYQEMLAQAPVYLYYCGSADPARVEAAFRAAFAGLPNGGTPSRPADPSSKQPDRTCSPVPRRHGRGAGKADSRLPHWGQLPQPREHRPGLLFNAIYGGTTTSKLFLHVREKLSLCYFANSSLAQNKGILQVYSGVEFANFQKAEEEILAQLAACQEGRDLPRGVGSGPPFRHGKPPHHLGCPGTFGGVLAQPLCLWDRLPRRKCWRRKSTGSPWTRWWKPLRRFSWTASTPCGERRANP